MSSPINNFKKDKWDNKDLSDFYENVPIQALREYAIKGGLENGCDVEIVYPYIANAKSVLEVGAAYGRVIKQLIRKGYKGEIYAVERSKKLYEYLKENYKEKEIEIIQSDILNFSPSYKIDAILWMWSNIAEFPKKNQLFVLKHLASLLNPNGLIVIDIMPHDVSSSNMPYNKDNQTYQESSPYGVLYGYAPSMEEIHLYAKDAGFSKVVSIDYITPANRPRILYVLSGLGARSLSST